jgi:hypothetical protein
VTSGRVILTSSNEPSPLSRNKHACGNLSFQHFVRSP